MQRKRYRKTKDGWKKYVLFCKLSVECTPWIKKVINYCDDFYNSWNENYISIEFIIK